LSPCAGGSQATPAPSPSSPSAAPWCSSSREADGQWLPLAPLIVVAAVAFASPIRSPYWRSGLVAALLGASAVNFLGWSELVPGLGQPRYLRLAGISIALTDGRSFVQQRAEGNGYPPWSRSNRPPDTIRAWAPFNHSVTVLVAQYAMAHDVVPCVFFAGDRVGAFFNPWALQMDDRFAVHSGMFTGTLAVTDVARPVEAYRKQLHDPRYGWPNILITIDEMQGDLSTVSPRQAEIAAGLEGFAPVSTLAMPGGGTARIWWFQRGAPIRGGQRGYLVP
jgi:hypothetical protein